MYSATVQTSVSVDELMGDHGATAKTFVRVDELVRVTTGRAGRGAEAPTEGRMSFPIRHRSTLPCGPVKECQCFSMRLGNCAAQIAICTTPNQPSNEP